MEDFEDFPERYAEALAAIEPSAAAEVSRDEVGAMLRLSREVAHRSERRWAPVSTYLAGRFVAARMAAGVDLEVAVGEALSAAEALLPPGPDDGREERAGP